jgi:hypothetical protein
MEEVKGQVVKFGEEEGCVAWEDFCIECRVLERVEGGA